MDPFTIIFILAIGYITVSTIRAVIAPKTRNRSNMPLLVNRRGGNRIPSRRIAHQSPLQPRFEEKSHEDKPHDASEIFEFECSPRDVLETKKILMQIGKLPVELADIILDEAEYWACSATTVVYTQLPQDHLMIRGGSNDEDRFLLRTMPLGLTGWSPSDDEDEAWRHRAMPKELQEEYPLQTLRKLVNDGATLEHPCRKIVFDITSKDQGWGGSPELRGTFKDSWTWFDAGLERFDAMANANYDESADSAKDAAEDITVSSIRPVWPPVTTVDTAEAAPEPRVLNPVLLPLQVQQATPAISSEKAPNSTPRKVYDHELHATPDHMIQCNKHATRETQHHYVEWSWNDNVDPDSSAGEELHKAGRGRATGNGEFVRNLKLGDIVTVWGRARFSGWQNLIDRVEVKVYWAV